MVWHTQRAVGSSTRTGLSGNGTCEAQLVACQFRNGRHRRRPDQLQHLPVVHRLSLVWAQLLQQLCIKDMSLVTSWSHLAPVRRERKERLRRRVHNVYDFLGRHTVPALWRRTIACDPMKTQLGTASTRQLAAGREAQREPRRRGKAQYQKLHGSHCQTPQLKRLQTGLAGLASRPVRG